MKKSVRFIFAIILMIVVMFGLAACSFGTKLPGTAHEKVQFALNGVESSLKGSKRLSSNDDNAQIVQRLANSISGDSLSTIYNSMEVEKETNNPDFEYDEPPMIQFQCLKALYESIGDDFAFGTKYSDTITGSVYYDFKTRTAPEEEKYLQNYSFICSVSLDIDSNDLITSNVGFDLTFTHESEIHHEKMYVEMVLDYDMNDKKPTYELSMNAYTDLLEYEANDEKYSNDEYDYVKVEKNEIKEWRKFGICSPENLENYQSEDFAYKYSVLRAFKDSKKYKTTNSYSKNQTLKAAVIDCLDLQNSFSDYKAFFASSSTTNSKITEVVNKFSGIFKKDVVNSIVYTGGSEKWESDHQEFQNLFLRALTTTEDNPVITEDCEIINLFNPNSNITFGDKGGKKDYITIYLKNGETETVATYNNFDNLNVKVRSKAYDKTEWIDVNGLETDLFSTFVAKSGYRQEFLGDGYQDILLEFDISLKSDPSVKLQSELVVTLKNDSVARSLLNKWSQVTKFINAYSPFKDMIPEFEGPEGVVFTVSIYSGSSGGKENAPVFEGRIGYDASSDLPQSVSKYKEKLKGLEFVEDYYNNTYTKRIDDDYILKIKVYDQGMDFAFYASKKPAQTITDVINSLIDDETIEIPEFKGDYEYQVEYGNNIRLSIDKNEIVTNYIESLANYGFLVTERDGMKSAYMYKDGTLLRLRDMGKTIAVEKVMFSLTAVGDFNGWNTNDTTRDFVKIKSSQFANISFEIEVKMNAEQAFKIVKNHTFNDGGYGFNQFSGSNTFDPKLYDCGQNENIIVKENGVYTITVTLGVSMFNSDYSQNTCDVLMIDVVKQ